MGGKIIYFALKRGLDVLLSLLLLLLLFLPLAAISLAVKLSSEGEAIFKQIRVGKNGKTFVCFKVRTMYKTAPPSVATSKLALAERHITPVGRFLRRTSLDELPQLFNVLRGDMSLVGPRPLIPEELDMHKGRQSLGVYRVRPGITGLAQIKGRDRLSDAEKLALDGEYVNKMSILLDVKILFLTLFSAVRGKDVEEGERLGDFSGK